VPVKPQLRQITSCRARAGQHARPSHKHCKACAKHAHAPRPRTRACLYFFNLEEFSHHPVPEGGGAGEMSSENVIRNLKNENYEMKTCAPVAQTLQSVLQHAHAPLCTCPHKFVRFSSITVPIQTNPYHFGEQQVKSQIQIT